MAGGSLLPGMFRGWKNKRSPRQSAIRKSVSEVAITRTAYRFHQNEMPDADSHESSSGIAVDVQQRLNCALP
jgi:hypothetical protein